MRIIYLPADERTHVLVERVLFGRDWHIDVEAADESEGHLVCRIRAPGETREIRIARSGEGGPCSYSEPIDYPDLPDYTGDIRDAFSLAQFLPAGWKLTEAYGKGFNVTADRGVLVLDEHNRGHTVTETVPLAFARTPEHAITLAALAARGVAVCQYVHDNAPGMPVKQWMDVLLQEA